MRKKLSFLMLLAALVMPWALNAQEVVEIGSGTTTSSYLPSYNFYKYSWSQQIYTAEEVGQAGNIVSVAFKNDGTTKTRTYNIYMAHTTKEEFTSTTDWVAMSASDLVFSGEVTLTSGEWTVFDFDTPFAYNGSDNLLISVADNSGAYTSSPHMACLVFTATNQALYKYQDGSAIDIATPGVTGTRPAFKNQIQLGITGGDVTCYRVKGLACAGIGSESATISWVDTNNSTGTTYDIYMLTPTDTTIISSGVTDTFYTVTDLNSNTTYTFGVVANCGGGDEASMAKVTVTTACAPVATDSLPWTYGFEDASANSASATFNVCLGRYREGTSTLYPYPSATHHGEGAHSLYMYRGAAACSWLTLPLFEEELTELQLSFYAYRSTTATNGYWAVGVMTDPADLTTFDTIATGQVSANSIWELVEVPLSGYDGHGTYLTILCPMGSGGNYTYIDDITVDYMPACVRPLGVTVSDITPYTATIDINDPTQNGNYILYLTHGEVTDSIELTDLTYDLEELQPATTYQVVVVSVCGDGTVTNPVNTSFSTPCVAISNFPWQQTFDDITNINELNCWNRYSGLYNDEGAFSLTEATAGWILHSLHGMDGSQHVKVNIFGTTCKYWIMTPWLEISEGLELSFDYSLTTYNSDNPMDGVVTDDRFVVFAVTSDDTYVPLAKWGSDTTRDDYSYEAIPNTPTNFVYPLSEFADQTIRIAFYGESTVTGDDNDLHVDNILVAVATDCAKPTAVWATTVTSDMAVINWVDTAATGNYEVQYFPTNATESSDTMTIAVTDTIVELENLTPNTEYGVNVMANCGELSNPRSMTFRTACVPFSTLPWTENFDSLPSGAVPYCWTNMNGNNTVRNSSTLSHSGSQFLDFRGTYRNLVALPAFDPELGNLMMHFWTRPESTSASCGSFSVGYVTSIGDTGSFVALETYAVADFGSSVTYQEKIVSLPALPEGGCIAFRQNANATNYFWYVDDIEIYAAPSCARLQQLAAENVTHQSADIVITDTAEVNNYVITVVTEDDTANAVTYVANTTTYALTGLTPLTNYTVTVVTNCGDDEYTYPTTISFRTTRYCGEDVINIVDTIGDGTSSSYYYTFYASSTYKRAFTEAFFTAQELNELGLQTNNRINGIQLHSGTTGGTIRQAKIYMKETSLDSYTTTTPANDTIDRTTMTLVYSGDLVVPASSWVEILFDSAFNYSGTSNLVIMFAHDTTSTAGVTFYYTTQSEYRNAYFYMSSTSTTYSGTRSTSRPNVIFDICTEIPDCMRPSNVTLTDYNDNSFNLTWTGNAAQYEVAVSTTPINPDSVSGLTVYTTDTNAYTVTGLNPSTTYYYYVRGLCGGASGNSEWSIEGSVTTSCAPMALPYSEDFESYGSGSSYGISPCWTKGTNNASTAYPYPYGTNVVNGQRSLYFYGYRTSTATYYSYAALPMFQDSVKHLSLSFSVRRGTSATDAYNTLLVIGVMTNPEDLATFTPMDTLDLFGEPASSVHGYEYYFNNYTGDGKYIAIYAPVPDHHGTVTTSYNYAYVDDIYVDLIPSCPRPTVTVSNVTSGSAIVHWNHSAANFEVEYGPQGFNHVGGTTVASTGDSLVLTGLTPGTGYDVYVRALCSATETSPWSFAAAFITDCGPIPIPYSENFNVSLANHPCWNGASNATAAQVFAGTALTLGSATSWTYASAVRDGLEAGHYYKNVYGTTTKAWLITPEIDLSQVPSAQLSFDVALTNFNAAALPVLNGDTNSSQALMVIVSTDGGNTWLETNATKWQNVGGDYTYASLASTSWLTQEVDLTPYVGDTIRIAFYCQSLWSGGDNDLHLDNIFIGLAPACPRAYGLTARNATQNSVVLEWQDTIGSTQWMVSYALDGDTSWNTVTATANPYTLTGLTPNTVYKYRVAPVCANGEVSDWSLAICRFSTSQVPATVPYNYNYEDAAEWANWQTASNSNVNWYRGNVAEGNTTNAMYISADNGATHSWNLNSVTNAVAYRDIDFGTAVHGFQVDFDAYIGGTIAHNYDGIAVVLTDPSTPVESYNTNITSPWGHVNNVSYGTVRHDTLWGHHTVYLDSVSGVKRLAFYHFNQATGANNAYEDNPSAIDNISVTMQVCERPNSLEVTYVAATSASVAWNGDATAQYEIRYRVHGQPASANAYQTVTGLSATVNGLAPATDYDWWVRRVCTLTATDTVVSGWVEGNLFSTLCIPVSVIDTLFEDFESTTPASYSATSGTHLPNCWNSWSTSTTATPIYPHVTDSGSYSYCVSGHNAVTLTAGTATGNYGSDAYLSLPNIAEPTNTLTIAFWMCTESSTNGFLEVGYLTGPDYTTDFVSIKHIAASSATLHTGNGPQPAGKGIRDTVSFDSVPAGNLPICFRWNYTSSFYSVCLDDIAVWSSVAACNAPAVDIDTVGEDMALVNWVGTASTYEVAVMEGEWVEPASGTAVTGYTFTFDNLQPNHTYSIGVRSACGTDYYSEWVHTTVTTLAHPCYAPTDVTVSDITLHGATISWTAGEEGQSSFEVHVYNNTYNETYTVQATSYEVTGLYMNTAYNVEVRAVCGEDNYSGWTAAEPFTTADCVAPTGVTATANGRDVTVSWQSTGASRYRVAYFDEFTSSDNATVVEVENATSTTVTVPEGDMQYSFFVYAYCDNVLSNPSDEVTVDILGIGDVNMSEVNLYPNPASTTVTVSGLEGENTVTVVDMNGRTVYTATATADLTIDLTGMAKGAYFVRITGEQATAVRKLIVR